jgi:serine/threonine protein kinase
MQVQQQCPSCQRVIPDRAPGGLCPSCVIQMGKQGDLGHANTMHWNSDSPVGLAEIAMRLPNLEFIEVIGSGGMGTVFKARQKSLDRLVAVKLLSSKICNDPSFAERFNREARTLAKLNHPNIVTVFESGEIEGRYYIVMEYIDGINLRDAIRAKTLSAEDALSIVPQICDALFYAHQESIVHRDIKPENILLDKKGKVKIADFGLAKLLGDSMEFLTLTGTNQVVGTLNYMAPEQLERPLAVDHRADIYSLGVVFYELLTGELPIGRFSPPSFFAVGDEKLDEVVFRTLEKQPDRRYQHASEVKTAVEQYRPAPEFTTEPKPIFEKPTALNQNYRVPFNIPDLHGGFATADGILRFDGQSIEIECQSKDSIFGTIKSGTINVSTPISDIVYIRSKGRSCKQIIIQTDKLSTAAQVPGSESGTIKLSIASPDRETAMAFVCDVQQYLQQPSEIDDSGFFYKASTPYSEYEAKRKLLIPSLGMMTAGGLNLLCAITVGILFTVMMSRGESFMFVDVNSQSTSMAISVLIIATFGVGVPLLIGALMIAGSAQMLQVKHQGFSMFTCMLGLIPIHFGILVGIPFGIWGLATLNNRRMQLTFDEMREMLDVPDSKPVVPDKKP